MRYVWDGVYASLLLDEAEAEAELDAASEDDAELEGGTKMDT
jgi:hypothetical protein